MKKFFSGLALLTAAVLLAGCEDEFGKGGDGRMTFDENTIAFTLGQSSNTRAAGTASTVVAPSNVFDLPGETDEEPDFCLVETVTDMDEEAYDAVGTTRGTPVYTENFYDLYGSDLYGTAFEPQEGSAQLTDVWGSYLENGGTVNFKKVADTDNTYAYDYSRGQKVNLAWPEGNKLLYFLQAPYATTSALNPKFYADGHIEFDYTDPTTPVSGIIVNGAAAQKDFLFTSKVMEKDTKDTKNHVLLYHALTGVKFKVGNEDKLANSTEYRTNITKVVFKGIKANGHCTIRPNYADGVNTSEGNPSNKKNDTNASTKSSASSIWSQHSTGEDLVVNYSQTYSGVVDYAKGDGSNFADSFYDTDKNTHLKNMGKKDGSEILFMVPQSLKDVELVVYFKINGKDEEYQRSVKFSDSSEWKAGELHTYTLTINKVDVSVTDTMNEPELTQKTNPDVKNTGNVTAYLRAAYTIAWYYGYGNNAIAVAAYQGNGEFTTGDNSGLSTRWIKGEDGFYYYPDPVRPNTSAKYKLFSQFDAPAKTEKGPFQGAHLEMKILVQAVQFDEDKSKKRVGTAWGDIHTVDADGNPTATTVVSLLGTTPEGSNL